MKYLLSLSHYLKSVGRAIHSEKQCRAIRTINRVIEEILKDVSFDTKALPKLLGDTKFCVEENEKSYIWLQQLDSSQVKQAR